MKSFTKYLNEVMNERKYHLSYDVINCKKDFKDDYELARGFILYKLKELGATSVQSPCKSTIIFTHPSANFNMKLFNREMKDYFYFSICLVAKIDGKNIENINNSKVINDVELQKIWKEIKMS